MSVPVLRPMGYGELLDETFDVYRDNFPMVVGITALVHVPAGLMLAFLMPTVTPGDPTEVWTLMPVMMGLTLVYAFVTTVGNAALVVAMAQRYLHAPASIGDAYRDIMRRLPGFVGLVVLQFLMIVVASFLLVLPGIYLALATVFAIPAFLIEECGVVAALERSLQLARGHWWRIFLLILASGTLIILVQAIPTGLLATLLQVNLRLYTVSSYLWQAFSQTFLVPIQVIAILLLYYDVRVRKEGYDVELLAREAE